MKISENDIKQMVTESVKRILSEGISNITYHFTSLQSCIKMLSKNAFYLTMSSNRADAYDNKRLFYLSTQRGRNKQIGYAGHFGSCVRVELDGKKLATLYKGKPIDYWGGEMGKQSYYSELGNSVYGKGFNDSRRTHHNFEMEDRIFSYTPTIENASNYITRIDVYIDPHTESLQNTKVQKRIDNINEMINNEKIDAMTIYTLCNRFKIPFYCYLSLKDFNYMTDNTINAEIDDMYKNHYNIQKSADYRDTELYKAGKGFSIRGTKAGVLYELFNVLTLGRISREPQYYKLIADVLKKYGLEQYKHDVFKELRGWGKSASESCSLLSGTVNAPIRKLNTEHGDNDSVKIMKFGADILRKFGVNNFDDLARKLK